MGVIESKQSVYWKFEMGIGEVYRFCTTIWKLGNLNNLYGNFKTRIGNDFERKFDITSA